MSQLTTHILDTTTGRPAVHVRVGLYQLVERDWKMVAEGSTDENGRVSDLLQADMLLAHGTYKLTFGTSEYFRAAGIATFYPYVDVIFEITSAEHYHVPVLLNPFGYTTYRGS
jgi:5-hydroxyisourate hydrolase